MQRDHPPVVFMLYVAHQKAGQLVADALRGSGIAAEDAPVYNVLERRGAITPTELAAALGMGLSTLTYRLRGLERRGHVTRSRNPGDGRSHVLRLTPEGLRRWRRLFPALASALRSAESRLAVPQREVGATLEALIGALDEELSERSRGIRRASRRGRA